MNRKDQVKAENLKREASFRAIGGEVYSFSYALTQNKELSKTRVKNILSSIKYDQTIHYLFEKDQLSKNDYFKIKKNLFRKIYQVSRPEDYKVSSLGEKTSIFFYLSLEQRASLYLKYKAYFNFEDISNVLGLNKGQVQLTIAEGKSELGTLSGTIPPQERGIYAAV